MCYQPNIEGAIRNTNRFMDATECYPLKLVEGAKMVDRSLVNPDGLKKYVEKVTQGTFPQPENWFGMND
jgi:ketopantoate hydroxymethyltransferase